jgi:hypothetical protein
LTGRGARVSARLPELGFLFAGAQVDEFQVAQLI